MPKVSSNLVIYLEEPYLLESLVNDTPMLEMIVREEVKLIEEIPDVYAAKRIHLGEWENTWESAYKSALSHSSVRGFLT